MNPVLQCLFNHRSIRKYKDVPLEEEKLQYIIRAAQQAPTWCNGQQVSIVAVKDKARKELFSKFCFGQKYIAECSVFLVFCADFYRVSYAFEKAGKSKEAFEKYITDPECLIIGAHDVGIALQNAVVAAESLGLGTVDIGGIRIKPIEVASELNLPRYCVPMIGLCVGYADQEPGLKPRLPPSAVYFEEKYDVNKAKAGVDEYDEVFKKYLSSRGSNTRESNWSKSISDVYIQTTGMSSDDIPLFKKQGFADLSKNK